MASDATDSLVARWCLVRKTLVGSLASKPSGVTLPTASPARNALSAWPKLRLAPGGMHIRQQAARTANRAPASASTATMTPADALNAFENVGDTRTPDDVREEDEAAERAGDGEQVPAAGGLAHGSVFTSNGHRFTTKATMITKRY